MRKFLSLAVVLSALAITSIAQADVVSTNYQFRGASADANFWGGSADGCAWWSGYISGGQNVSHMVRGRPVSSAYTYAYIYGYNWCTGQNFNGWGSAESASIDNLNGAVLSVPVTVQSSVCTWVDCTGSSDPRCAPPPPRCDPAVDPWCCDPITGFCPPPPPPPSGYMDCTYVEQTGNFDAALVGVGDVYRGMSMNNVSSGPYRSVWRDIGSSRQAEATATLVVGGRNLLAGATGYGSLRNNSSSSHTFYRY